jgi:hypothetical protein
MISEEDGKQPTRARRHIHQESTMQSMIFLRPEGFRAKRRPTQRAADGGYAPRFLSVFAAWSFSRFESDSTLPPTAANASRWAVPERCTWERK